MSDNKELGFTAGGQAGLILGLVLGICLALFSVSYGSWKVGKMSGEFLCSMTEHDVERREMMLEMALDQRDKAWRELNKLKGKP